MPPSTLEAAELVELNGELYGVFALEVIRSPIPAGNFAGELVPQKPSELVSVRFEGAALVRNGQQRRAALTAKGEHDFPTVKRVRLFPTVQASFPVGHATEDAASNLAETLKEGFRVGIPFNPEGGV